MIFGICVFEEPIQQLEWCVKNIRRTHFDSIIFVINDGSDIDYASACEKHGAYYIKSENLKKIEYGAAWWHRFFSASLKFAEVFDEKFTFKVDPDTKFHRKLRGTPDFDVSGTIENDYLVQGGCQCFRIEAVKRILKSKICLDSRFKIFDYAMPDNSFFNKSHYDKGYLYNAYQGKISTDFTIRKIAELLSLSVGAWDEVDCISPKLPIHLTRPLSNKAAITHPHKEDWSLPTVDSIVMNYKRPNNISPILNRLKEQTVPTRITLIDCSEDGIDCKEADRIIRLDNLGSINRFMISPSYFDVDYVYFHDDDALPGKQLIEYYIEQWNAVENPGVIGQFGKNLLNDKYAIKNEVQMSSNPKQVDFVQRSYFSKPERLLEFHDTWIKKFKNYSPYHCMDDVLLSSFLAMKGYKNYLTSIPNHNQMAIQKELNDSHAIWRTPGAIDRKSKMTEVLVSMGWVGINVATNRSISQTISP